MSISPWDGKEWDITERLALSFLSLWGKDCGSIRRILQIIKAPPPSLRKHLQAWRSSQDVYNGSEKVLAGRVPC